MIGFKQKSLPVCSKADLTVPVDGFLFKKQAADAVRTFPPGTKSYRRKG